jgi:hypothetical protein
MLRCRGVFIGVDLLVLELVNDYIVVWGFRFV